MTDKTQTHETLEVKRSDIEAVLAGLEYAEQRLVPGSDAQGAPNLGLFRDLKSRCRRLLLPTGSISAEACAQARYDRLAHDCESTAYRTRYDRRAHDRESTAYRMLVAGEHVLEGDDIYTYDPETLELAWVPVTDDTPACGRKWSLRRFMPVRRRDDKATQ